MSYITIRDFGEDKFIEKNQNLLVMLRGAKVKKRQRPLFRKLKIYTSRLLTIAMLIL